MATEPGQVIKGGNKCGGSILAFDPGNAEATVRPYENTLHAFIQNDKSGPGSQQGKFGEGIARPYDVKFGPDGAMYIIDFGSQRTSLKRIADGHFPIDFDRETGMIWRVTKINKSVD